MKCFIAGLLAETNSFSPIPTGDEAFMQSQYFGDATAHPANLASAPLHVWRKQSEVDSCDVVESICAYAGAGGITARHTFERLRDRLLDDLAQALPCDLVLLHLHGSMVAHGYDDCEGDMLARVRSIVGPNTVIGVELDLHCNITPAMLDAATLLVCYKENPHTDIADRALDVYRLSLAAARREISPVMAVAECRIIGTWNTLAEPLRSFVRTIETLEIEGDALSISFSYGFAFCDVANNGAKILVVGDGDHDRAMRLAIALSHDVWAMREAAVWQNVGLSDALARAIPSTGKPMVIGDFCDNAGGGAPSDSTFILQAIIEQNIADVASGIYWDPMAVGICKEAGEGAQLRLRIGGKASVSSGDPVDADVIVRRIHFNATQPFGDLSIGIGDAVWVELANRVDLVLSSLRQQVFHPAVFSQFGIDLSSKTLVSVKSAMHFRAAFAPIASDIVFPVTGGLLGQDYRSIPYRKFTSKYWPRFLDPFE